jgi:tyrosinase
MAVRVRQNVFTLDPPAPNQWHPTLLWYARAIGQMQQRPLNDPRSWRYQAAIHDYVRSQDPLGTPSDALPSTALQQQFWRQCQHFSWFFLPWHRMYLFYFEQIIIDAIKELGGPHADWALPYWNYSDNANANARRLPPAFQASTMPDGTPNPLRVNARNAGANTNAIVADDFDVDIADCLSEPQFVAQPAGGNPGFGGAQTGFNHSSGIGGKLENVPHGSMHMAVGGFMSRFNTAGLDPLFWLHHCNIDRLWTVWQKRSAAHQDPTQSLWLTGVSFDFNDAFGAIATHTSSEVVDTTASPLLYDYDDVSDPLGGLEGAPEGVAMGERPIPEMVGATDRPVMLTGQPVTTSLSVSPPTGPAGGLEGVGAEPAEIYLNIENIRGGGTPTSYLVYLNVPPGESPEQHPELLAGNLSMFGVAEASESTDVHAGSGVHYALKVGKVVRRLREQNAWNPADVRITFVPRPRRLPEGAPEAAPQPVHVGRVSLYYT